MQNKPTTVEEMWVRGGLSCTAEDYGLCSQNEDDVKEKLPFRNVASCSRLWNTNKAGAQMCCFPECFWERPVLWVTLSVNMKSQLTLFAFLTHVPGLKVHDSSWVLFQSRSLPSKQSKSQNFSHLLKTCFQGVGCWWCPHSLCPQTAYSAYMEQWYRTGIVVVKATLSYLDLLILAQYHAFFSVFSGAQPWDARTVERLHALSF